MKHLKIPKPTVKRLAIYYRCLVKMKENGTEKTSSKEISEALGLKSTQVRKDLSYFGEFGKRGVGYDVEKLAFKLKEILGLKRNWNIAIVGAGNLGSAIANYAGMEKNGFKVVAAFDVDNNKIGKMIMPGVNVSNISDMKNKLEEENVEIAILAVPASSAQKTAEELVSYGIHGILNFTPTSLSLPEEISVEDVDFVISLKSLTFEISTGNEE